MKGNEELNFLRRKSLYKETNPLIYSANLLWLLYDRDLRHERVKSSRPTNDIKSNIFTGA